MNNNLPGQFQKKLPWRTIPKEELAKLDDSAIHNYVLAAKRSEAMELRSTGRESQVEYLSREDTTSIRSDACLLARIVYEEVLNATESFEVGGIGADLSYLMGAIVKNSFIEWESDRLPALHGILKEKFPSPEHPVWSYISIAQPVTPPTES